MSKDAKSCVGQVVLIVILTVWVGFLGFMYFQNRLFGVSPTNTAKMVGATLAASDAKVKPFGVNLATGAVTSSAPTINPTDPYNPMPLRVGTIGAIYFHHPFCPHAKQSLATHGLEKRINFWTREQIAESNRSGDHFCLAGTFDCSNVQPAEFAISGNDPWCGANIRNSHYAVTGVDAAIAGKTLCQVQGRIGIFVDDPDNCISGAIRGSSSSCDQETCGACTADCETVCDGCTKITMALLNKVTLFMGDANKDGQADLEDYLYYHECYSGHIAATIPCQNVFDFDNDTDVDAIDFDLFVRAYNTGNASWAAANYPEAVINPPKPELPLRVGTEGSQYYHRLDCPSVNNSWQTWGINRRVDYFSWEQVEASGRVSDAAICLAGNRSNPSGSLQNCTLDDDEDGTLNCEDECPLDPLKIAPGECGCGVVDSTDGSPCP